MKIHFDFSNLQNFFELQNKIELIFTKMYETNKYDGKKELQEAIKMLPHIPTNTEIVEKTGMSKGSISDIMNGKRIPTEKFVIAFKKGFKLIDVEIKNPQTNEGDYTLLREIIKTQSKQIEFLQELLLKK